LIFLDTTVFVYANIKDYSEHDACLEELQELVISDELMVNVIVLSECYHILSTEHKLDKSEVIYRLKGLIKSRKVTYAHITTETFKRAMKISEEFNMRINDAICCACMEENGIRRILTTNEKHFRKIPWITVENPLS